METCVLQQGLGDGVSQWPLMRDFGRVTEYVLVVFPVPVHCDEGEKITLGYPHGPAKAVRYDFQARSSDGRFGWTH
jgi:hypothetical protein